LPNWWTVHSICVYFVRIVRIVVQLVSDMACSSAGLLHGLQFSLRVYLGRSLVQRHEHATEPAMETPKGRAVRDECLAAQWHAVFEACLIRHKTRNRGCRLLQSFSRAQPASADPAYSYTGQVLLTSFLIAVTGCVLRGASNNYPVVANVLCS